MVREAEANASEDARRRQEIEVRNSTDALVYSTQRALTEHGAKLSDGERSAVEHALTEAREALAGEDTDRIRRAQEELTRVAQTLATAAQRPAPGGDGGQPAGGPAQEDVVDAEFRDVDERKAS
jgi:molecular chaperone DnaK